MEDMLVITLTELEERRPIDELELALRLAFPVSRIKLLAVLT
jgi:hypothetical protein